MEKKEYQPIPGKIKTITKGHFISNLYGKDFCSGEITKISQELSSHEPIRKYTYPGEFEKISFLLKYKGKYMNNKELKINKFYVTSAFQFALQLDEEGKSIMKFIIDEWDEKNQTFSGTYKMDFPIDHGTFQFTFISEKDWEKRKDKIITFKIPGFSEFTNNLWNQNIIESIGRDKCSPLSFNISYEWQNTSLLDIFEYEVETIHKINGKKYKLLVNWGELE